MAAAVTCIVVTQMKLAVCIRVGSGQTMELSTGGLCFLLFLHLNFGTCFQQACSSGKISDGEGSGEGGGGGGVLELFLTKTFPPIKKNKLLCRGK